MTHHLHDHELLERIVTRWYGAASADTGALLDIASDMVAFYRSGGSFGALRRAMYAAELRPGAVHHVTEDFTPGSLVTLPPSTIVTLGGVTTAVDQPGEGGIKVSLPEHSLSTGEPLGVPKGGRDKDEDPRIQAFEYAQKVAKKMYVPGSVDGETPRIAFAGLRELRALRNSEPALKSAIYQRHDAWWVWTGEHVRQIILLPPGLMEACRHAEYEDPSDSPFPFLSRWIAQEAPIENN